MNGSNFTLIDSGCFRFRTLPGTGDYSGYIPLRLARDEQGGVEFEIDVDVDVGSVGIAAVDSDMGIISERQSSRGGGAQKLKLRAPELGDIAGLLLRNADHRGLSSEGTLMKISFRPVAGPIFAPPKPTLSGVLSLPLRQREGPVGGTEQSPASGGGHRTSLKRLSTAETAVVIIDPWAKHECPGWELRLSDNLSKFLLPALMAFRSTGIPIIYAPHDRMMSPAIRPTEDELVMQGILSPRDIAHGLKAAGITHLIYMGYASNYCLMSRPIGAINMWRAGFGIIVVRDASIALETSETFAGEWSHRVMMDFVEASLGATTSVDEIRQAADRIEVDQSRGKRLGDSSLPEPVSSQNS